MILDNLESLGMTMSGGYRKRRVLSHPRADARGYVHEHLLIAEAAIGHHLFLPIEIHHFNEIKTDNANTNLVICEDRAYHQLLHKNKNLIDAGGIVGVHARCCRCKRVLPLDDFYNHRGKAGRKDNQCKKCNRAHSNASRWRLEASRKGAL